MNHGILVGAGFLLGTLGVKALKSEPVRKAAVATVAQGLKVKEEAESIVDEAKASSTTSSPKLATTRAQKKLKKRPLRNSPKPRK